MKKILRGPSDPFLMPRPAISPLGEGKAEDRRHAFLTGSLALAGGLAGQRGSLVAIDMWNARGRDLEQYEIVPVEADDQSNPDVAIREAERLINVEKVPVILGIYSSSIAVPLAPICDKNKTIFWITIAISDKVVEDRHLQYVFRPQPMGSQWGAELDRISQRQSIQTGI